MATVDFRLTRESEVNADNPVAGDLHKDGTELALVTGAAAVAQEVEVRWRWFRGEWFLDRSAGTPWFDEILEKGVSLATVKSLLVREALRVADVLRVRSLALLIDGKTRELSGTAEIDSIEGPAEVAV